MVGRDVAHFRVVEPIASGGMGVVYRAEDTRLRREVALKLPLPHLFATIRAPPLSARGTRGGRARSPECLRRARAGGDRRRTPIIAMPFCAGETLKARLAREGAFRRRWRRHRAVDRARARRRARGGVVHRDVKPGNVMLLADGGLKVLDFGLACATSIRAFRARRPGRQRYMAPEQLSASRSTPGRTSGRSASCSTRCSPAAPFVGAITPPSTTQSCTKTRCRSHHLPRSAARSRGSRRSAVAEEPRAPPCHRRRGRRCTRCGTRRCEYRVTTPAAATSHHRAFGRYTPRDRGCGCRAVPARRDDRSSCRSRVSADGERRAQNQGLRTNDLSPSLCNRLVQQLDQMHDGHPSSDLLEAGGNLQQTPWIAGDDGLRFSAHDVGDLAVAKLCRGFRLEQVVDAGGPAANLRFSHLAHLDAGNTLQQPARRHADALGVLQMAGVVIRDAQIDSSPWSARLEFRQRLPKCRGISRRTLSPARRTFSLRSRWPYRFIAEPQPARIDHDRVDVDHRRTHR